MVKIGTNVLADFDAATHCTTLYRTTENLLRTAKDARATLEGMNLAQYFMVAPFIDILLDYLPKPAAKECFKKVFKTVERRGIEYLRTPGDAENLLDVCLSNNRRKLHELGIPREQYIDFGGEYIE